MTPFLIDILTVFPEMFTSPFEQSIIKRARERGLLTIRTHDIRAFATDHQHMTDDYPYGGGGGMVMKVEPVDRALASLTLSPDTEVILMTPQGERFHQRLAQELAMRTHLVLICGHYEGVDERIRTNLATRELSIGDYILTGGELAAMVVVDAVSRFIPGVLGNAAAAVEDSFSTGLLEYPQYTRPRVYRGWEVPPILLSGHHEEIRRWRRQEALKRTLARRPDLLLAADLTPEERKWLTGR